MNYTSPFNTATTKTHNADGMKNIFLFLLLFTAYLCFNLTFRWLRWGLFHGHGHSGWSQPDMLGYAYLLFVTWIHPIFICGMLYWVRSLFPRAINVYSLFVVGWLLLLIIEGDLAWYQMSKSHITWSDMMIFLTEDWQNHLGLRTSDTIRFLIIGGIHGVIMLGIACLAVFISNHYAKYIPKLQKGIFIIILTSLVFIEGAVTAKIKSSEHEQLTIITDRHPLRIGWFEKILSPVSTNHSDLMEANKTLRSLSMNIKPQLYSSNSKSIFTDSGNIRNIVVLALEGVNANLTNKETMPFLTKLAESSLSFKNHYTSGNATQYGILGIIFGHPPTFFHGALTDIERTQNISVYIDRLNQFGYSSRLYIGNPNANHMDDYFDNFTLPIFQGHEDDWRAIPALHNDLKIHTPLFSLVYYYKTHFPYSHKSEYSKFLPEVPEDFDYGSWNQEQNKQEIINRYRNALFEMDDWIANIVNGIDLSNTILVITGDHGEEMFENGAHGHSRDLRDPQVKTPMVISIPGSLPKEYSQITSHTDILPTILDIVGIPPIELGFSQSIFFADRKWSAVTSRQNHDNTPKQWSAVTAKGKSFFNLSPCNNAEFTSFRDTSDEPTLYLDDPTGWLSNLELVSRLEKIAANNGC